LDAETHDISLDKKKFPCLRPKAFVEMVKKNKDRLDSTSFNTQQFLDELSNAYDLLVMKNKVEAGSGILLTNIYKMLVPMSRFKKDYNAQAFAFDLARLYTHRDLKTSGGRSFSFGSDRKASKLIRILDSNGQEQYLGTIAFILE
jgi:hypothetical protein